LLSTYSAGLRMNAECCPECEDAGRIQLFELDRNLPSMLELMLYKRQADVPCPYCMRSDFEEWMRLYGRVYFG